MGWWKLGVCICLAHGSIRAPYRIVLTQGSISGHRGRKKGISHTRGVIALCPDNMTLKPGESEIIEWKIFTHDGAGDFCDEASKSGCNIISADKYLVAPGQCVSIKSYSGKAKTIKIPDVVGDYRHDISYGKGKSTFADFYVVEDKDSLIANRLRFILNNQRMTNAADARYGAFMIYDCEGDSIYPNDTPNCNPVDRDEGAERTGMGVFAAKYCIAKQSKDKRLIATLEDYAWFIRTKLQDPDYKTFVAPVAQFLSQMHLLTKNQDYLNHLKIQIPVMEAFNGFQPSVHLNDIAIRHWDGFWFGKSEMYGDVFPHYWSTITASAFHFYSLCTGDESWQRRAENIVDNNLCLFMPDGKASCAYLYPRRIDGKPAKFYDVYAND